MREIQKYFEELETTENYMGYYYNLQDTVTIVILGGICGLKNVSQIHQWAENERIRKFLERNFKSVRSPATTGHCAC